MNKKIQALAIFLVLGIFIFLHIDYSYAAGGSAHEVGINLGAHWDAKTANDASAIVGPGGWITIMATAGSSDELIKVLSNTESKRLNVVIRAYNGSQLFDLPQASAWTAILGCVLYEAENKTQKIYLMPWNEPYQPGESSPLNPEKGDSGAITTAVIEYMQQLDSDLRDSSVRNQVGLLSPMFNIYNSQYAIPQMPTVGPAVYGLCDGAAMNLYCAYGSMNPSDLWGSALLTGTGYRNEWLSLYGGGHLSVFAVETGAACGSTRAGVCPGWIRYREFQPLIRAYYERVYKPGSPSPGLWESDGKFRMFSIFSYCPDPNCPDQHVDWIWGSDIAGYFGSVQQSGGSLETGSEIDYAGKFQEWLGNYDFDICEDTICGFIPEGREDLCNPVHGGRRPGSGRALMCYISPSPSRYGAGVSGIIDPDCPDRVVTPGVIPPEPGPGGPTQPTSCLTFGKSADKYCLESPEDVTYTLTITTHACDEETTNVFINDPELGLSNYSVRNLSQNDQEVLTLVKQNVLTNIINTATLNADTGSDHHTIQSSASVFYKGAGGCQGCEVAFAPYFCQKDYTDPPYHCPNGDIAHEGCAIAAEAMLINHYVEQGNPAEPTDPFDICKNWGININSGASARYIGDALTSRHLPCGSNSSDPYFNSISNLLCTGGKPVIARYQRASLPHTVVITKLDFANRKVTVRDPYNWGCSNRGNGGQVTHDFADFYSWAKHDATKCKVYFH